VGGVTREEKVAKAQALRAGGLTVCEVAERMGVARSTAGAWLADPDRSKEVARKDSYRGVCKDCGAPTDGSNGRDKAPAHCAQCAPSHSAIWTRETVIGAIRCFAERYGRPPGAADFNPSLALRLGHGWRSDHFYEDGDYPVTSSVLYVFGTWNAAIEAAGFKPTRLGSYARTSNYAERGAHLVDERRAA
jgi:hypothetical protein